jgi:PmbA protein
MSEVGGDPQALLALAQRVVAQAASGEQLEAYISRDQETSVRVYEGELEHLTSAQSEGIGIRVVRDGRVGFAYTGVLDEAAVTEALAEARDNAAFGTPDEWAGLATPDGVRVPTLTLWNDALAAVPTADKIALAKALEKRTLSLDPRIRVEDAGYSDVLAEAVVATSTGIAVHARESGCYVSVSTLADDGDETQTGWAYSVGRSVDELDIEAAAAEGVERAVRLLGAVKPASGAITVVLDPFVTAQFLGIVGSTLNGEAVLKGRSLFAGRLAESVAAASITLVDDPTNPLAFSATEVDGEGLAARRNVLIDGGVLQQFVQSSYSGRRSGSASTGNAVRGGFKGTPGCGCLALSLVPGVGTQAELVAGVSDGVLVQMVAGLHSGVNPVSGDFSTGASGLRIRNGQVAEPIKEFTIASTLQRMLQSVTAVGADLTWLPMRAAGVSLVIEGITMSGS